MAKSQEATTAWTVADLASLYSEHRTSLVSQARRMLRSDSEANEVVQEAFIKFILAAPELDTEGRALAYSHTFAQQLTTSHSTLFALAEAAQILLQLIQILQQNASQKSLLKTTSQRTNHSLQPKTQPSSNLL